MFDLKNIKRAIDQIAEEKGIDAAQVLEVIESSIATAYRKEYAQKGEVVRCKFDLKTGELKFWKVKTVVDETTVRIVEEGEEEPVQESFVRQPEEGGEEKLPRYNPDRHIFLDEAKKEKKSAKVCDESEFSL